MELVEIAPRRPRRRFWLQFILLLCFLTCLILGIGSLTALLMLRRAPSPVTDSAALPTVAPLRINQRLALNLLGGDPADALVHQAIAAGDIETAWSILAFDTTIADEKKAVLYASLSKRLRTSNLPQYDDGALVKEIQRLARATVVLAPDIDGAVRGQVLAQSVGDLLAVGEKEEALVSAINLQRLSERMPDLLPVQRRQLLEPLSQHVKALDSEDFEQRLAELLRNPFLTPTGSLLNLQLSEKIMVPVMDEVLISAISARQEAAKTLSQSGVDNAGGVARLAETLRLEESIRREMTEPRLADQSIDAGARLGILLDRYRWTALKAQVASRGFGLSIVPEWEENRGVIEAELSSTIQQINGTIDQIMDLEPTAQEKAALRVEKFLWLVLQAERGLFPNASLPILSNDLRFAQAELDIQGATLALPVFWDASLEQPENVFQPVGQ